MKALPTRRSILAGAAALPLATSFTQLSRADALDDARLLRRIYTELHPGLTRYNTPAQIEGRFAWLAHELAGASNLGQRYLALAGLTAAIRCGHTYPNFYNQSKAVTGQLFGGATRLPFTFTWTGGEMVVLQNFAGVGLKRGTAVTALAGVPTAQILAALMPLSRADGHNDFKRIRNLDVRGYDRWEAFDIYLPMLMPALFENGRIAIEGRDPSGHRVKTRAPLLTADARKTLLGTQTKPDANTPLWRINVASKISWLTMPDWSVYDSKWDWKAWLEEALDRVIAARSRVLVVDLRGNEGGLDCGDPILARLIETPLPASVYERRVRYRRTPRDLDPYLDTWDDSFRDWGNSASGPDADGFYRLTRYDDDSSGHTLITPKWPRFTGHLIVLTDAANSSATFNFAQCVQHNKLGTLVGAPTGGNRRGINGGAFFFVRLPASGLEVDLPVIGTFAATQEPDAGLLPDIVAETTAASIAAEKDPCRDAIERRV